MTGTKICIAFLWLKTLDEQAASAVVGVTCVWSGDKFTMKVKAIPAMPVCANASMQMVRIPVEAAGQHRFSHKLRIGPNGPRKPADRMNAVRCFCGPFSLAGWCSYLKPVFVCTCCCNEDGRKDRGGSMQLNIFQSMAHAVSEAMSASPGIGGAGILNMVLHAGPMVKAVMAGLLGLSLVCWGIIVAKAQPASKDQQGIRGIHRPVHAAEELQYAP